VKKRFFLVDAAFFLHVITILVFFGKLSLSFFIGLISKRLLLLTTVENIEWIRAESNGPLSTNNKLYENSLLL
jgi:hypothetical protein